MRLALTEAQAALAADDVPVGAVVLDASGTVVGTGHNDRARPTTTPPATRRSSRSAPPRPRVASLAARRLHARRHARAVHDVRRRRWCSPGSTASSSGRSDDKLGAVGSLWDVVRDRRLNHRPEVVAGRAGRRVDRPPRRLLRTAPLGWASDEHRPPRHPRGRAGPGPVAVGLQHRVRDRDRRRRRAGRAVRPDPRAARDRGCPRRGRRRGGGVRPGEPPAGHLVRRPGRAARGALRRAHPPLGGIGTQVLALCRWIARDLGSPEMHINVDEVDVDTRRFYERHGFVNIEDGVDYRMLCYIGPTTPPSGGLRGIGRPRSSSHTAARPSGAEGYRETRDPPHARPTRHPTSEHTGKRCPATIPPRKVVTHRRRRALSQRTRPLPPPGTPQPDQVGATALASTLTPMQAVSQRSRRQTVSAAPGSGPRT